MRKLGGIGSALTSNAKLNSHPKAARLSMHSEAISPSQSF